MYTNVYTPTTASEVPGNSGNQVPKSDGGVNQFENFAGLYANPYLLPNGHMYSQGLSTSNIAAGPTKPVQNEARTPVLPQAPQLSAYYPPYGLVPPPHVGAASQGGHLPHQFPMQYPGYATPGYPAPTGFPMPQMFPMLHPDSAEADLNRKRGSAAMSSLDMRKRQKTFKDSKRAGSEKKKKSKYRGVFWHTRGKAWVSSIMVNGKTTHLGYYDDEIEAARVYDKEAIRLKGITCAVNFPDSIERFGGKNADVSAIPTDKTSTRHERKRAERISKYRGVCWNKCNSSWKACIKIDGKNKHIGYFTNEVEAAKAYDVKALQVRGPNAKLNFPETSS